MLLRSNTPFLPRLPYQSLICPHLSIFAGKIDLAFNDAYIHHVYSSIVRRAIPTHVVVLGDLFSSQWIDDKEFAIRVKRYKNIFDENIPYSSISSGMHFVENDAVRQGA